MSRLPAEAFCWSLLVGGTMGCGVPTDNGASQMISNGLSPSSLVEPPKESGGRIDLARVQFLGTSLHSSLAGIDAGFDASGQTLVVAGARFAYPPSSFPLESSALLPKAPERLEGEDLRCTIELGPMTSSTHLPGVPVDVGDRIQVRGVSSAVGFSLLRRPLLLEDVVASSLRYEYVDRILSPTVDNAQETNWVAGAAIAMSFAGAGPALEEDLAKHPLSTALQGELTLPRALLQVAVSGEVAMAPTKDPLTLEVSSSGQRFVLPSDATPLEVSWTEWDASLSLVISLEFYGPGAGRCPSGCNAEGDCCKDDTQCSTTEHCEERPDSGRRTCLPQQGVGTDRLGAVVCSAADTGRLSLASSHWMDLEKALETTGKLGLVKQVVLRVGRTTESNLTSGDIMLPDGTRHSMNPLRARATDLVLIPLERSVSEP